MRKHERGLSAWQLTMLALGTVIGGSFFLGCSVAIHASGPSVIFGFIFGGVLVYLILGALSEMTASNPGPGSFRAFASEAFGPGLGFVVGWTYWTGMVFAMSSEAAAISALMQAWLPNISVAWVGSAVIAAVTALNLLGARKLSNLESLLAALKIFTIVSFIAIALALIAGLFPGRPAVGLGELQSEPLLPHGFAGLAGSLLVIMFTYAGFEVIGLAATEAENPGKTVPRAIRYTVVSLVGLYVVFILLLLPLIPTEQVSETTSPIVMALQRSGLAWAGSAMNAVMITAILSTMLAAMFALGRMIRSLTAERMAPRWLSDKSDVPYRGILCSGAAMLIALRFGLFFPRVYLFLISSGGFALLFSYAVIMASQLRLRQKNGIPNGSIRLRGAPYTAWFALFSLLAAMFSMVFIKGQLSGLIAGVALVAFFAGLYAAVRSFRKSRTGQKPPLRKLGTVEFSKELNGFRNPEHKRDDGGDGSGQG